jgi:hypothetical protein
MWNPLGVMIAALGLLFAVGAIVSGVVLFRQSSEYRGLLQAAVEENRRVVHAYLEEKSEQVEELRESVNTQVVVWKGQLEKATGEQRAKLHTLIEQVEKFERKLPAKTPIFPSISSSLSTNPSAWTSALSKLGQLEKKSSLTAPLPGLFGCMKCGRVYSVPRGEAPICPHCQQPA